jgi:8-oxo-dGTP diphosphatase
VDDFVIADRRALVDLRCSAVLFRGDSVLLLRRQSEGKDDWVLPGGPPQPGEATDKCARREVERQAGLRVDVTAVAFLLEAIEPGPISRLIEIMFLARDRDPTRAPRGREAALEPSFVALDTLSTLPLRPPVSDYLHSLHEAPSRSTAPYLGDRWLPEHAPPPVAGGAR